MHDPQHESRPCTRVRLTLPAELRVGDTVHRLAIKNVSLSGTCLETAETFKVGTACHVTLLLDGYEAPLRCEIDGLVVRNGPGEVGVAFLQVAGIDSFEHLHNLLLYNDGETHRIAGEFEHYLGLRRQD